MRVKTGLVNQNSVKLRRWSISTYCDSAEQATIRGYNPLFRPIGAEEAAWEAVAKEERAWTMAGVTMEEPSIRMAAEDTAEAEGQTEAAEDTAEVEQEVEMEVTEAAIGGGASRRQIWDQSRMFDPGFFLAYFQI